MVVDGRVKAGENVAGESLEPFGPRATGRVNRTLPKPFPSVVRSIVTYDFCVFVIELYNARPFFFSIADWRTTDVRR